MEIKWVECEVIGRTREIRGLLFKKTHYIIAIRIPDANPETASREVTFDQYVNTSVGQQITVKMYCSKNGWCFTEQEANLSNRPSAS